MNSIIAIDPGASGGFAWVDRDDIVQAEAMPKGMTAQADRLREIVLDAGIDRIVIERVGTYVPGNSGPAAATFSRHCGHVEAIAYMLGVPADQVAPGVWMKGLGAWPKDKKERKHAIREAMQRRHPHLRVTLKTADALGILAYAERGTA